MSKPERIYRVRYAVDFGTFTRSDLGSMGGCDAIMVASILRGADPHGSAVSTLFLSKDSYSRAEMVATEKFRTWALLAHDLMGQSLPDWHHRLVTAAHEAVKAKLTEGRK